MNWYSSNLCSNTFRSHITYPLSKMCVSDIMYMKTMLHLLYKKKKKNDLLKAIEIKTFHNIYVLR